jgi:23S rRNA maturation mini-RNase III
MTDPRPVRRQQQWQIFEKLFVTVILVEIKTKTWQLHETTKRYSSKRIQSQNSSTPTQKKTDKKDI